MEVIIYTQDHCPPCEWVKNFFNEKNIQFIEKNIKIKQNKIEMIDLDAMSTPFILINQTPVYHVDIKKIEELLEENNA